MAHASEKKVLIVDDEPDVRNFLAACIEDAGFQIDTAVDGTDALEKVERNQPDLMTLDMVMPRTSGIQLIRKLREKEEFKNLPIIVITAHARDEFGSEDFKEFAAFASGLRPRYIMDKPITPEKLVKAIADILDVKTEEELPQNQSERHELMNVIRNSDEETLKKIGQLLKNKT